MFEFFDSIDTTDLSFSTSGQLLQNLPEEWDRNNHLFNRLKIGQSEEGRPIHAFIAGRGDKNIALLGGAHSDEPVGPEMLRLLVKSLAKNKPQARPLLQKYTFIIIPHINPDSAMKNQTWINNWPDLTSYAAHAFREPPGRDLEFGYPEMRPENKAVADFLRQYAPFELYINFHGMAFAEGIMLLIERHWIERTKQLRSDFRAIAESHNLSLHDHDRGGEKGFEYIGPGFTTTPEGRAMQLHFKEKGDIETASKFHLSSMEYIHSLGGDPLCLVTELPLFIVSLNEKTNRSPGIPKAYLEFKKQLPELRKHAANNESLQPLLKLFEINSLPLQTAAEIQLSVIKKALKMLSDV